MITDRSVEESLSEASTVFNDCSPKESLSEAFATVTNRSVEESLSELFVAVVSCFEKEIRSVISAPASDLSMEGAGDHFVLMLPGQLDEVDSVAGDTDRKLWISFRMFLGIQESFFI